jgi:hypothetical protein
MTRALDRALQRQSQKNYILNGGMQVSQENGATAVTASGAYPVDQFSIGFSNAGTQTAQQVASATPGGSPNRLRVTATVADASVAAGDYLVVRHPIEGDRVADLRIGSAAAKTVTIQFGVKAPAGTYCVALRNAAISRTYNAEYTISAGEANTEVVKSVNIQLDTSGAWATDNTIGLEILWALMTGTTSQTPSGVWNSANVFASANQFNFMGANGNVFELFDVGLYEGSVAPAFQLPDFDQELDRCMRYWEKSYDYATAVGTTTNNGVRGSIQNSGPTALGTGTFLKRKRAAPSVTVYSPQGGAAGFGYDNANRAAAPSNIGESQFLVVGAFGISTVPILYHFTANARM